MLHTRMPRLALVDWLIVGAYLRLRDQMPRRRRVDRVVSPLIGSAL